MFLRRSFVIAVGLLMAILLAACGSNTTTGGSPYGSGSTNPTPTTPPAATPTSGGSSSALIQTATATVKGQSETILTNAQGMTLYYFTPDTVTKSACTGQCAKLWPPLLSTGSGAPSSATSLPGKLNAQTNENGSQVEYNGHPLYAYSGDTAPGQTNGEGLFGKWFVATPNLTVLGGASPSTTPTSSGYGY
jgi:predicted lipoprotein with Yx(FWY)xxD motif